MEEDDIYTVDTDDIYTVDSDAAADTNQKQNPQPVKVSLEAALELIPKWTGSKSKQLQEILSSVVKDVYDKLPWEETSPKNTGGKFTAMKKQKQNFGISLTNVRKRTDKNQPKLTDVRQLLDETGARELIHDEHIRNVLLPRIQPQIKQFSNHAAIGRDGLCMHL